MNDYNRDLWQGGPWEQPSPVFPDPPAVRIPAAARVSRRPVLRLRRKRRRWPWFLGLAALIGLICLSAVLLDRYFSLPIRDRFPSAGEDWRYEQQETHSSGPPSGPTRGRG